MDILRGISLRPPYDPELITSDDTQHRDVPATIEDLQNLRETEPTVDKAITGDPAIAITEKIIDGPRGDIHVTMLQSSSFEASHNLRPGIVFLHGGGMVMGNPFVGLAAVSDMVKEVNAVVISPAYRLAPEYQEMALVEDCYATLSWTAHNFESLNIDPSRLMIAGVSAGAGLAAGVTLLARDRSGPKLCAQLLVCPMLDDRCDSISNRQFEQGRGYYTEWGRYAWRCVLGNEARKEKVPIYVAAGRASDLTRLPPAYIDAGSAEPFRDEDVAYASKLWACGVQADLHIWSGGGHCFDMFGPPSWIGGVAIQRRKAWLRRMLEKPK